MTPKFLYKVLSYSLWEQSLGKEALLLPEEDEAFVHFSTQEQLERILVKYWANVRKYVVLKIDPSRLTGELVLESNRGGSTKYYHLYNGSIPLKAVIESSISARP